MRTDFDKDVPFQNDLLVAQSSGHMQCYTTLLMEVIVTMRLQTYFFFLFFESSFSFDWKSLGEKKKSFATHIAKLTIKAQAVTVIDFGLKKQPSPALINLHSQAVAASSRLWPGRLNEMKTTVF